MKRLLPLLAPAAALCAPLGASAQSVVQTTIKVVGTCGTAVYVAGKMAYPTQDTTGVLCTSSSGGGGAVTIASGADVTEGAIGDSAWSGTGNGTLDAILKAIALQALSATPSLVNLTQVNSTTLLAGLGNTGTGALRVSPAFAGATEYNFSTATAETIEVVPLSGSLVTYVLFNKVFVDGTSAFTWKYGTGTNCGTGTTTLEGPYNLTAQNGWVEGNGSAPVLIVPAGKALCRTTGAGTTVTSGKILAVQF